MLVLVGRLIERRTACLLSRQRKTPRNKPKDRTVFESSMQTLDRTAELPEALRECLRLEGPLPTTAPEIPGFTVVDKVGEGGFGEVYRARDDLLDRDVALKLLRPHLRSRPGARENLLWEARTLARIRHPNVLTIYAVLEHEDQLILVTEFIDGESFEQRVDRAGPLTARETAATGIEICKALRAVHDADLVHRDLKTANILREQTGRIVLTDFGLGTSISASEAVVGDRRIAGSPLFMAPEQVRGEPLDARIDIYALGVALYHLSTGSFPLFGRDLKTLLDAIESGSSRPLSKVRKDLPGVFSSIVSRALAREPEKRFQTATEMELALKEFVLAA